MNWFAMDGDKDAYRSLMGLAAYIWTVFQSDLLSQPKITNKSVCFYFEKMLLTVIRVGGGTEKEAEL